MRITIISIFCILIFSEVSGQDCSILSKANRIAPDKLCSPVSVNWEVTYTGVSSTASSVQIQYRWDDGSVELRPAIATGPGSYRATASHSYISTGRKCNYSPGAVLVVDGIVCSSSSQQQIVTVWDDDNHNGGKLHIDPEIYPVCLGNSANMRFQDLSLFNCVPPQEKDVPNLYTRWVQWIYGTDITMTGTPVTVNGNSAVFPFSGPIITLTGPLSASGVFSDMINVAGDKNTGEYYQVTLRNWNYCNPYDNPDIPGLPADPVNGDSPPVVTTAIILIVPLPDATITPPDTLCLNGNTITLMAHDGGGVWSGAGVLNNSLNPSLAGTGAHLVSYNIIDNNGCTDSDQVTVTVMPVPVALLDSVGIMYSNQPPLTLKASPPGGVYSGSGVSNGIFDPGIAGVGKHIIKYITPPDRYGCSGSDTIHIKVIRPPLPHANFLPDSTGCSPLKVKFKNLSQLGDHYLWDFGDKTFSQDKNPEHTYYIPGSFIVKLTVSNSTGQATFNRVISVNQSPSAIFTLYPTEIINNSQIVVFTNLSIYGISYLWDFGDGNQSTEENPWHKYESEGSYSVSLKVTSTDGCIDSLKYTSNVIVDYKEGSIKFPNVFKWNESGPTGGYWTEGELNDNVFRPFVTNVTKYELQIYNRWGTLIYTSNDLHKGWDGYFSKGDLALQGVYVWKVTGQYADGSYFEIVGDVTFLH